MTAFIRAPTGGLVLTKPGNALTPAETDEFLQVLNNELETAGAAVVEARNAVASLKESYEKAKARLLLSAECPRVGRGAMDVTAAERDAWLMVRFEAEHWALHRAEVRLESAAEYMWKVKDQVHLVQSLNNNAKELVGTNRGGAR